MSQLELFDVAEIGERKLLPPAAQAASRCRATPAPIGSGPAGQSCRSCSHYTRVRHHDQTFRKCELMRGDWTHGPGTDIKASYAACRLFELRTGDVATAGDWM